MSGRVTRSRNSVGGSQAQSGTKRDHEDQQAAASKRQKTARKSDIKKEDLSSEPAPKTKKSARGKTTKPDFEEALKAAAKIQPDGKDSLSTSSPEKKSQKANPYNLTPGSSPYPSYERPTPEECRHVNKLLASVHGEVTAPKTIPAPNLESSGCGEVPSVLDALIRTRLSAATNNANSSRAFRGLVERFGVIKEGVGKGSVNWDKVRRAPVKDVFDAIKTGGLADVKSRDIQKILNMVYEETIEKKAASNGTGNKKEVVLSLDRLHSMSNEEAFDKLLGYPGVGPKTASCVLLFCMQRPSFAVDTHVFRLVSWLGWVPSDSAVRRMAKEAKMSDSGAKPPPPVTRNTTYSHLDVRIPDELKYPLHYLLIQHGKKCPSCSAKKDSKVASAWGNKKCPLAGLKNGKSNNSIKNEDVDASQPVKTESESGDNSAAETD